MTVETAMCVVQGFAINQDTKGLLARSNVQDANGSFLTDICPVLVLYVDMFGEREAITETAFSMVALELLASQT